MADSTLNVFVSSGTTVDRLAFTPAPPSPVAGAANGYLWWDTDLQQEFSYDFGSASWVTTAGGSGTVTNSGTLTNNAVILGAGTTVVSALGSLGTTTTVLHGNAAGAPSFGAVATGDLAANAVTYAKIQNVSANSVLLGSGSAGSGAVPSEIALGSGLAMSGTTLNATGSGGTVTHTGALTSGELVFGNGTADIAVGDLSGDVSTSGSGATTIGALKVATGMIQASAVTLAKIQSAAANSKLVGSGAAGSGSAYTELTLGTNLSMSGTTLNATGGGGSGTVTNTGTLTNHALVKGNGGVDVSPLGSLGTTTTVLHGNAAGDPTFGAVDLTAEVTGDLPFANLTPASGASLLLGRGSASGAGDFQEITLGTGLTMSGTALSASGSSSLGVPIVVDTNTTLLTDQGMVVPERLEVAAGEILEIQGGARAEVTGPAIPPRTPTVLADVTLTHAADGLASGPIPGGYKLLEIYMLLRTSENVSTGSQIAVFVNGDTGNNYNRQFMRAVTTTVSGSTGASQSGWLLVVAGAGSTTGVFSTLNFTFPFYAETTADKSGSLISARSDPTAASGMIEQQGLNWTNTSAMTSLTVIPSVVGIQLVTGSRLLIYGR